MRALRLHRFWPIVLAAPMMLAPLSVGHTQTRANAPLALPSLGDGADMTLNDERRLGDQIARSIYRDPAYLDDPALSAYLQRLWDPLIRSAQARGDLSPDLVERFAWNVALIRDKSVNAFALPGGYLGVHLGLIATVATPDELASVLAHELSHVSQRHISRLISRQSQQAPLVLAAMILGALAANASKNADIGTAAIASGSALAAQSQLNFSRDMEREADRVGFGIMTDAGFAGEGFVTMFAKLQQASRLNDDGSFPYLRSHPLTTERIADMRARLPDHHQGSGEPIAQSAAARVVSPELHSLMAARARVMADDRIDHLRVQVQLGKNATQPRRDPETLGARYAGALAASQLRDTTTAMDCLALLHAGMPQDPEARQAIRWLTLEVLMQLDLPATTEAPLIKLTDLREEALRNGNREALLLGARAALNGPASVLNDATQKLQTWTSLNPQDAQAWQTLAVIYNARGDGVRAARAEAEAHLAQLDAQGALDRFKSAQRLIRQGAQADHIEQSILDSRVRHAEAIVRQQYLESREGRR